MRGGRRWGTSLPVQLAASPADGFFEAARWWDGTLWYSDYRNRTVNRLRADGTAEVVAELAGRPSGIGFAPDGAPLVLSIEDAKLWRLGDGEPEELADLSGRAIGTHDMAVDDAGRAYISEWGFDVWAGARAQATGILVRHPDGRVERCGDGLVMPNGIAITHDGSTLVVAETFAEPTARLVAFAIEADGTLGAKRTFAELGEAGADAPDGLCLDVEGGAWVAIPGKGEFRRVVEGGEVTDVVHVPAEDGNYCVDCALGGPDLRTLFMLVSETTGERLADGYDAVSRVETVAVTVPGY
jgi:sugar lactone lactonase YvrE